MKKKICLLAVSCTLLLSATAFSQIIPVVELGSAPQLDGNASDWQAYPAVDVPLTGQLAPKNVSVRSGVFGDEVFFVLQWKDATHDAKHHPFVWDAAKEKYDKGKEKEDRFVFNFAMEGDFTHDWFSGKTFKADNWHWKAARSNPIGLAQDKLVIITNEKSKKAYKATAKNGKEIYILRPSDSGDALYKTKRYATKEKDVMPKYILNDHVKGSIADVQAKGAWANGQWTLELKRKLNTGHADDAVFAKGKAVEAAMAVFDRSGDENHNISETLVFQF